MCHCGSWKYQLPRFLHKLNTNLTFFWGGGMKNWSRNAKKHFKSYNVFFNHIFSQGQWPTSVSWQRATINKVSPNLRILQTNGRFAWQRAEGHFPPSPLSPAVCSPHQTNVSCFDVYRFCLFLLKPHWNWKGLHEVMRGLCVKSFYS